MFGMATREQATGSVLVTTADAVCILRMELGGFNDRESVYPLRWWSVDDYVAALSGAYRLYMRDGEFDIAEAIMCEMMRVRNTGKGEGVSW